MEWGKWNRYSTLSCHSLKCHKQFIFMSHCSTADYGKSRQGIVYDLWYLVTEMIVFHMTIITECLKQMWNYACLTCGGGESGYSFHFRNRDFIMLHGRHFWKTNNCITCIAIRIFWQLNSDRHCNVNMYWSNVYKTNVKVY